MSLVRTASAAGLGGTLLPGARRAQAQEQQRIMKEMIAQAETIAGMDSAEAVRSQRATDSRTRRPPLFAV